jgi:hypothetical protein
LKLSLVFSYVVKRLLHIRHWRLRLIIRPPSLERESITLSLSSLQKGHITAKPTPPFGRDNGERRIINHQSSIINQQSAIGN